ncbi:hypothetical protein [Serratia sp. DD3]|uniref:hypothetical protein n=1 Tax=Serratia sp. DD3 TaxID=1410619 RepID=UPI0004D908F9|nr:hypothetical protein [Serratia sp. DD3]KEY57277.1 hypothetical protein SRDD_37700 [Serratia sp. DD3]
MNKFAKSVWLGLILNIIFFVIAWFIATSLPYDQLDYSMRDLVDMMSILVIPFGIAVVIQIISLILLLKLPKFGLALASISSLIMLPISMLFFIGYSFSYEKQVNSALTPFNQNDRNKLVNELNFKTSSFLVRGIVLVVIGVILCLILPPKAPGFLLISVGILLLYQAVRLKNHIMIGLLHDNLAITLTQFSDTYLIPLRDVTLIKENKQIVKLHIKSAGIDRKCILAKGWIEEENYQVALADILTKLARQP